MRFTPDQREGLRRAVALITASRAHPVDSSFSAEIATSYGADRLPSTTSPSETLWALLEEETKNSGGLQTLCILTLKELESRGVDLDEYLQALAREVAD